MAEVFGSAGGAIGGLAASNDAMQGIISASSSGSFTVTPEAGDELIRTFEDFPSELGEMQRDLRQLARETPLGGSPAGQAISEFNKQVAAAGDGRSCEELLTQMRERMPQVIEAIKKGIQTYQDVDEGNASGVQQ